MFVLEFNNKSVSVSVSRRSSPTHGPADAGDVPTAGTIQSLCLNPHEISLNTHTMSV